MCTHVWCFRSDPPLWHLGSSAVLAVSLLLVFVAVCDHAQVDADGFYMFIFYFWGEALHVLVTTDADALVFTQTRPGTVIYLLYMDMLR